MPDSVERTRHFHGISTDEVRQLKEKVVDITGLYLNPPEQALVLGVDEKSQIQALQRTQPMLPRQPGKVASRVFQKGTFQPGGEGVIIGSNGDGGGACLHQGLKWEIPGNSFAEASCC